MFGGGWGGERSAACSRRRPLTPRWTSSPRTSRRLASPYVGDKHAGRLRGMVFVGAPVGDDEWVAEELRFIFGKLVSRLPALARMRDAGRLQVATQARTLLLRYCAKNGEKDKMVKKIKW